MERYAKWRNMSFQISKEPIEKWIPEAIIDVIEGSKVSHAQVLLSDEDCERVERGEIIFSKPEQAKAAAEKAEAEATLSELRERVRQESRVPNRSVQKSLGIGFDERADSRKIWHPGPWRAR